MRLTLIPLMVALVLVFEPSPPIANAQDSSAKPAPEEAPVAAEVIILHATNSGKGIDPKLGKMRELEQPPFSSYDSYELLGKDNLALGKGKSTTTKLPNGRVLMVSLKDVVLPKKKDEAKRFVVSASIQKPDGKTFLPLLEVNARAGETFFVAGQSHKGGILVIGIKVIP
jgi:hypothetical protein